MKKENGKTWLPRGEYRSRWDMPHGRATDYNRDRLKRSTKKRVEEEKDDINWCPRCGVGSYIFDVLCDKCLEEDLDGRFGH